ncbi:MAG TPA: Rpn family recombination-promoting nuclease/putative transposase [Planctomycetota bacterium]|nr:Rpn family recombination-promoting nuclease/putative transposase [Planctomycetota bacterium]
MATATPHDSLFHFTFRHPRHSAGWLRTVMPAALVAAIDWATLREAPEKVHGQTLRLLITDNLFEVAMLPAGHRLFVLIEHKSYVDREAPGQILRYSVHIAHSTRVEGEPPALVVPVLLCHGETAWPELEPPHPHVEVLAPEAAAVLTTLQPAMRLLIDDLNRCAERELRRAGLTALAQLTLLCLRFLRDWTAAEALAGLDRWGDLLVAVDRDEGPPLGREAVARIGWYCLHVTKIPAEDLHVTFERILKRPEETIMSTAEKLQREGRAEGRIEGRVEGRAELLVRLLTKRFGPLSTEAVARINSATIAELDRWGERLLDANTLTEVFTAG